MFLRSNKLYQLESNGKKLLGFRNMQEKLEKIINDDYESLFTKQWG